MLAVHTDGFPAGGEHGRSRPTRHVAGEQDLLDDLSHTVEHMLTVVEHQQHASPASELA